MCDRIYKTSKAAIDSGTAIPEPRPPFTDAWSLTQACPFQQYPWACFWACGEAEKKELRFTPSVVFAARYKAVLSKIVYKYIISFEMDAV